MNDGQLIEQLQARIAELERDNAKMREDAARIRSHYINMRVTELAWQCYHTRADELTRRVEADFKRDYPALAQQDTTGATP